MALNSARPKKIALWSGRCDPPHLGHVVSLQKIGATFDFVHVVLFDYPGRAFPVVYCHQILEDVLSRSKGIYDISINSTHFGEITKKELKTYDKFDTYISGNLQCIEHIASLGHDTWYDERAYHYQASTDRMADEILKIVQKHKNL